MKNTEIIIGSNKSFGVVCFIVFFLIIAIYPLLNDNSIRLWSLIIGIIFLILGIIRSTFLINSKGKVHKIWSNVRVKDHAKSVVEELNNI